MLTWTAAERITRAYIARHAYTLSPDLDPDDLVSEAYILFRAMQDKVTRERVARKWGRDVADVSDGDLTRYQAAWMRRGVCGRVGDSCRAAGRRLSRDAVYSRTHSSGPPGTGYVGFTEVSAGDSNFEALELTLDAESLSEAATRVFTGSRTWDRDGYARRPGMSVDLLLEAKADVPHHRRGRLNLRDELRDKLGLYI